MDGWTIISLADEAADDSEPDNLLEPPVSELRCPEPRPSPDELAADELELAGDTEEEDEDELELDDSEVFDFGEPDEDDEPLPQSLFWDEE